jgi:hypothetical protein
VLESALEKLDLYDEIDDETGLYNARHLLAQTDLEVARARRYKTLFSVVTLDLPAAPFDALGRRKRRQVLRELGRQVGASVRTVDHVVHFRDGDVHRLAAILPETGTEGAEVFRGASPTGWWPCWPSATSRSRSPPRCRRASRCRATTPPSTPCGPMPAGSMPPSTGPPGPSTPRPAEPAADPSQRGGPGGTVRNHTRVIRPQTVDEALWIACGPVGGRPVSASFTHLHVHTEYSMLDGAARIGEVVASAVADGQPAIGITDHGNMYGILDFYKECRKQGVNPILGSELYMAHEHRSERPRRRGRMDDTGGDAEGGAKLYYHLTALAENEAGYKNLIQLASRAFLEGFYHKPRCLLPGQEIVTATGVKPVEEIEVGDLVLTHRGRLRPVTRVMSRHHDGDVYGVVLNNRYGRTTWLTGEHPVLVRDQRGERRWVEVQDIDAGRSTGRQEMASWKSFACLPKTIPDASVRTIRTSDHVGDGWVHDGDGEFVKETVRSVRGPTWHYSRMVDEVVLDYDFGFFVGLYAAEGAAARGEVVLSLHEDEFDLIDRARRAIKALIGKDATVCGRPDRPGYKGVRCDWELLERHSEA